MPKTSANSYCTKDVVTTENKLYVYLPEGFVKEPGDVIFLLSDMGKISPMCEKYITE